MFGPRVPFFFLPLDSEFYRFFLTYGVTSLVCSLCFVLFLVPMGSLGCTAFCLFLCFAVFGKDEPKVVGILLFGPRVSFLFFPTLILGLIPCFTTHY